ncbi:MAG: tyrosine-type recombinase/integrase [Candidatus Methanoperedens sp.]
MQFNHNKKHLLEMHIPEVNKQLSIEFLESCQTGMFGKKIGKDRAIITLRALRHLNRSLPDGKMWHDVTKRDIQTILLKAEEGNVPGWGEWEKYINMSLLRKFMTWLRSEYSYPAGYPDRERLIGLLPLMDHAPECKYHMLKPNKLKNLNEIPTQQEIDYMLAATDTYKDKTEGIRDKAFISIMGEIGMRISGLGILRLKDVSIDQIGALLGIHDKTMIGEPVRIIKSVPYLITWLNIHPTHADPDAPLWPVLRGKRKNKRIEYSGARKSLHKAVLAHNTYAESKGLPKITRRIHFHAFRYQAQTRDMIIGMPVSIQCKQRGWSPTSKQPMRYARVTTGQVDDWLVAHQ